MAYTYYSYHEFREKKVMPLDLARLGSLETD
jgi:hypothetical protein